MGTYNIGGKMKSSLEDFGHKVEDAKLTVEDKKRKKGNGKGEKILQEVGFGIAYIPAAALDLAGATVGVVTGLAAGLLKVGGNVVAVPAKALYGAGKSTQNPIGKSLFYAGSAVLSLPSATLFLVRQTVKMTQKIASTALGLAELPFKSLAWGIKGKNYVKEKREMLEAMKEAKESQGDEYFSKLHFIKDYIEKKQAGEFAAQFLQMPSKEEQEELLSDPEKWTNLYMI